MSIDPNAPATDACVSIRPGLIARDAVVAPFHGPWLARGLDVLEHGAGGSVRIVASVHAGMQVSDAEARAIARVVATIPDLLIAARDALAYMRGQLPRATPAGETPFVIHRLAAVLAAAEGRQ